jgi:hypothetical protein
MEELDARRFVATVGLRMTVGIQRATNESADPLRLFGLM